MKTIKFELIIAAVLLSLLTFGACERYDPEPQMNELEEVFSIPEAYLKIGDEFGRMVAYSLDWAGGNDVFGLDCFDEIIELFDKSILSYCEELHGYTPVELAELQKSIRLNRQRITNKNGLGDLENDLSEKQLTLLNEIIAVAGEYGKNGFMNKIMERVVPQITNLPEHEREIVYLSVAVISGALDVFNDLIDPEAKSRWNWGSFFCNAAAAGVGVIYGAAVGAFCPPCGVAVGIIVGASLSTAIC